MNPDAVGRRSFELRSDRHPAWRLWSRPPTRLDLDPEGIRIWYGPARSRLLRWADPRVQFALLDFREAPRNRPPWVRRPKRFEFRFRPELGGSGFAVPEEAYRALSAAALSAGLLLGPSVTGGGIPAGTKVSHYARRPPRWWSWAEKRAMGRPPPG